jgi:hypothetical protein
VVYVTVNGMYGLVFWLWVMMRSIGVSNIFMVYNGTCLHMRISYSLNYAQLPLFGQLDRLKAHGSNLLRILIYKVTSDDILFIYIYCNFIAFSSIYKYKFH